MRARAAVSLIPGAVGGLSRAVPAGFESLQFGGGDFSLNKIRDTPQNLPHVFGRLVLAVIIVYPYSRATDFLFEYDGHHESTSRCGL